MCLFFPSVTEDGSDLLVWGFFWELCAQNQSNALADLYTHGEQKPSQTILHNTRVLVWTPTYTVNTDWSSLSLPLTLSLSDQSATSEPRVGGVCPCWRTHPSKQQPAVSALQRQLWSCLWPAASPQWVFVFVNLHVCGIEGDSSSLSACVEVRSRCFRAHFHVQSKHMLHSCVREKHPLPLEWHSADWMFIYLFLYICLLDVQRQEYTKFVVDFPGLTEKAGQHETFDLPLVLVESEHSDSSDSRLINQLISLEWINVATF